MFDLTSEVSPGPYRKRFGDYGQSGTSLPPRSAAKIGKFSVRCMPVPDTDAANPNLDAFRSISPVVEQSAAFANVLSEYDPRSTIICLEVSDSKGKKHGHCFLKIGKVRLVEHFTGRRLTIAAMNLATIIGGSPSFRPDPCAIDAIVEFLQKDFPNLDGINVPALEQDGEHRHQFDMSPALQAGFAPYYEKRGAAWHEFQVPELYDSYLRALSKKRRYNLGRQKKLLWEAFDGQVDFIPVSTCDQFELLEEAFASLMPARGAESAKAYYRACASNGLLKCFILRANGKAVALATGVAYSGELLIHRMHFAHQIQHLSPGTCLWQLILQYACAEKYARIILGFGEAKQASTSENTIRSADSIIYIKSSPRSMVKVLPHFLFGCARSALKQLSSALRASNLNANGARSKAA